MALGRSPTTQSPDLVLACTLVKKFLEDNRFKSTSKAFEKELSKIQWASDRYDSLQEAGISSLHDLLSDAREMQAYLGRFTCRWTGCKREFPTSEDLFQHICDAHVGRQVTGNRILTCLWQGCEYKSAEKRDHLTSHVKVHIDYRPFTCDFCDKTFIRLTDNKKHMKARHSNKEESRATDVEAPASLKRKAPPSSPQMIAGPMKRLKVPQRLQLDGAESDSTSSAASSSSVSDSSTSSSDSESEEEDKATAAGPNPIEQGDLKSKSSSSDSESQSSDDSSESDSDVSSSSSDDSDSEISVSVSDRNGVVVHREEDQAASSSSGTIEGDKELSLEAASSEDTPRNRKLAISTGVAKKHIGARPTPLAQQSAKATPDSHISNAYISYEYAERAYQDLSVTRGKGFTKEKNKKKRGSYRGGAIDISGGKSFKFED